MSRSIQREMQIPQPPPQVWQALADSATLAQWMFPNDFEPRVGHRFTFRVPGDPTRKFDGLTVHCEVLVCDPPRSLVFSWSAAGLTDTRVSFSLEPDGDGTRLLFEHAGFDLSQAFGEQAFRGAEYGWAKMLKQLAAVVRRISSPMIDFWTRLEYRVCREIDGLRTDRYRGLWCDGFIPEKFEIADGLPRVTGRVWMGFGGKHQEQWDFVLLLPQGIASEADIDWEAIFPHDGVTGWLSLDQVKREVKVNPSAARPDSTTDAQRR